MASKLGSLVIELSANTARLQSDMGKAVGIAERGASALKKAFSFATAGVGGGLIASALIGAARQAIQLGDDLQKAAVKAGIGGKAISELAYAAKLADIDLNSLSTAIKKMQVSLSEAASGGKAQIVTLKALGLTIKEIKSLDADKQFELIAERISQLKNPADRTRAAVEIFGKAGADLLPLFERGAAGIREAREEAEKLGFSFGDETLKSLSDADTEIKRLTASWAAFAAVLTSEVAPGLRIALGLLHGTDARTASEKLDGEIALLQHRIATFVDPGAGRVGGIIGAGNSGQNMTYEEALALARRLEELQIQRAALDGPSGMGGRGRPGTEPPGFTDTEGAEKYRKEMEKIREAVKRTSLEGLKDRLDEWHKSREAMREYFDDFEKQNEEMIEATVDSMEDAWEVSRQKSLEAAAFTKDSLMTIYDNFVENGKVRWDELLQYMLMQLARSEFSKLLNSLFSGDSESGWGKFASWFGSLFGGGEIDGKASGGAVQAGKTYMVGEKGRELFRAGMPGTIVPNNALGGGGITVTQNNVFNGVGPELLKLLPPILKRQQEQIKADVFDGMRRGRYPQT